MFIDEGRRKGERELKGKREGEALVWCYLFNKLLF